MTELLDAVAAKLGEGRSLRPLLRWKQPGMDKKKLPVAPKPQDSISIRIYVRRTTLSLMILVIEFNHACHCHLPLKKVTSPTKDVPLQAATLAGGENPPDEAQVAGSKSAISPFYE
ncbi:hypothetical protein [Xanthomonas sp. 3075]|uniref:hypothetical protein n=1 Tax=Xanthomonas sp. 3075 TaxID=3035315 RepID=UPI0016109C9D|nr:hypothetical protein [Xanthomonas sp. 3075]MBB4130647.1 hypothetical protein [Xanthomonas sp. 3075]